MKSSVLLSVITAAILASCSLEEKLLPQSNNNTQGARIKSSANVVEVAKLLAKAVEQKELRNIIKKEAIKKFDNEYDVLFQLIKTKKIDEINTVENAILDQAEVKNKLKIKEILDNVPLLTIYVPSYFNANKWDTDSQIPFVAVRDENNKLIIFNSSGDSAEISPYEEPNLPIIVLKASNDRVTTKTLGNGNKNFNASSNNYIFNNGKDEYYFLNQIFNNINPKSKSARIASLWTTTFDPVVVSAYDRAIGCNQCTHRDWIYYGIDPQTGQNSGVLSTKFEEAITAFQFTNNSAQQVVGGWDEGAYVFHINGIFSPKGTTVVSPMPKVVPIAQEDLFIYHEEERIIYVGPYPVRYKVKVIDGTKTYVMPSPITFVAWDMEIYGDRWSMVMEEYDQTVTISKTFKNVTTYGANFSVNLGVKEKAGATFGASVTDTKETTTTYSSQEGNDEMGTATVNWKSPVLVFYNNTVVVPYRAKEAETYEFNTGTMKVSFESVRVAP